jgi:hypothetical protein
MDIGSIREKPPSEGLQRLWTRPRRDSLFAEGKVVD